MLQFVPSHLNNLHEYLVKLRDLDDSERIGQKFYSADVTSLYTNIDPKNAIDYIIQLLEEHWHDVPTYGLLLALADIRQILEVVINNSYFCYNTHVYLQILGLFMGLIPSPIAAIIRMYFFERNSIYIDITHISCYGRYIDDLGDLADSIDTALKRLKLISDQDQDKRLSFEIDFPSDDERFIPFLNSEIRINEDGSLSTRLFRKPQRKLITLHSNSHHPLKTKVNTIRNGYNLAEHISSQDQLCHSMKLMDELYINNGYKNPRLFLNRSESYKSNTNSRPQMRNNIFGTNKHVIKLPFVNNDLCWKIDNYIKQHKLPFTVVYTRSRNLRDILCKSRPFDMIECTRKDCKICPRLDGFNCTVKGVVYKIICNICEMDYLGETGRTAFERLSEHLNYTKNPTAKSYNDKTLAQHYLNYHKGQKSDLKFEILYLERNTLKRKIKEAYAINKLLPKLNEKIELENIRKYIM